MTQTNVNIRMDEETKKLDSFELLNSIYKPLCDKSSELKRGLQEAGYQVTVQFHNNHSVKQNNTFVTEYFPIPVISAENLGDIGIDIDSIWFEIILPKEKAIKLNYAKIISTYKIEVYGSENFLYDFYNEHIDILNIINNISNSSEENICVLFYLDKDTNYNELIKIAQLT